MARPSAAQQTWPISLVCCEDLCNRSPGFAPTCKSYKEREQEAASFQSRYVALADDLNRADGRVRLEQLIDLTASSDEEADASQRARQTSAAAAVMVSAQVERHHPANVAYQSVKRRRIESPPGKGLDFGAANTSVARPVKQKRLIGEDLLSALADDSDDDMPSAVPAKTAGINVQREVLRSTVQIPKVELPKIPKFDVAAWPAFKKRIRFIADSQSADLVTKSLPPAYLKSSNLALPRKFVSESRPLNTTKPAASFPSIPTLVLPGLESSSSSLKSFQAPQLQSEPLGTISNAAVPAVREIQARGGSIADKVLTPSKPSVPKVPPMPLVTTTSRQGEIDTVMKAFAFRQPNARFSISTDHLVPRLAQRTMQELLSPPVGIAVERSIKKTTQPAGRAAHSDLASQIDSSAVVFNTTSTTTVAPHVSTALTQPAVAIPQPMTLRPTAEISAPSSDSVLAPRSRNSATTTNTPLCDRAGMHLRVRSSPWTKAERLLLMHVKDFYPSGFPKDRLDMLFGRNYGGTSSTAYAKWMTDKKTNARQALDYDRHVPQINRIIASGGDMEYICRELQRYLDEDAHSGASLKPFATHTHQSVAAPSAVQVLEQRLRQTTRDPMAHPPHQVSTAPEISLRLAHARATAGLPSTFKTISPASSSSDPEVSADEERPNSVVQFFGVQNPVRGKVRSRRHEVKLTNVARRRTATLPYLSGAERSAAAEAVDEIDWSTETDARIQTVSNGTLHVPFTGQEIVQLTKYLCHKVRYSSPDQSLYKLSLLRTLVCHYGKDSLRVRELAAAAASNVLMERTAKSITSFLRDLADEPAGMNVELHIDLREKLTHRPLKHQLISKLHQQSMRAGYKCRDNVMSSMGPTKAYTYMSGDVGTIAFASNSNAFIAGSVCDESPEYNYPGNFVLGDSSSRTICNLDYHWKTVNDNEQSTASRLFYTVAMVDFSTDGRYFYSGGYDGMLRAYTTNQSTSGEIAYVDQATEVELLGELSFQAPIDLLRTSRYHDCVAIGAQITHAPVSLVRHSARQFSPSTSLPTDGRKNSHPTSLQWGPAYASNLLLGGFMDAGEDIKYGELALWDANTGQRLDTRHSSGIVFDVNWSGANRIFAAAMRPQHIANKSAKSVVRIYDTRAASWSSVFAMDCAARDINDVVFSPHDEHVVAAASTDGRIFVYDMRKPDNLPHVLNHGAPIDRKTQKEDTGVRFCAWSHSRHELVTGSSDGVVKSWDIYRSPEDTHSSDLANFSSGIYSGAFSPDFTHLAIGEVKKTITLLEPFNKGRDIMDLDGFEIVKATNDAAALPEKSAMGNATAPANRSCPIALCFEVEKLESQATLDDTRRWEGRIPAALVSGPAAESASSARIARRKAFQAIRQCVSCGSAARPSLDLETPLCERCGFSCTRCGRRVHLPVELDRVICPCGGEWTVGALGYELINPPRTTAETLTTAVADNDGKLAHADAEDADDFETSELYMQLWNLKLWNRQDSKYVDLWTGKEMKTAQQSF